MPARQRINGKRQQRACFNCRRKKVRCLGERPTCGFCARLGQDCIYPSPSAVDSPSPPMFQVQPQDVRVNLTPSREALHQGANHSSPSVLHSHSVDQYHGFAPGEVSVFRPMTTPSPHTDARQRTPPAQISNIASLAYSQGSPASPVTDLPFPSYTSQQLAVDKYFDHCHNQPYSFFHEETLRLQFSQKTLPQYIILAIMAVTLRHSKDPCYADDLSAAADNYASQSWRVILAECFEHDSDPGLRAVQGTTLLAIHKFTDGKYRNAWIRIGIATSIAQSLHMLEEPTMRSPASVQEEHRRTLWSVYLLDKLATCGRYRPALFKDSSLKLNLPCFEEEFSNSVPNRYPLTLESSANLNPKDLDVASPLAKAIVLTSNLSQIAEFAFSRTKCTTESLVLEYASRFNKLDSSLKSCDHYFSQSFPFDTSASPKELALCIFVHILHHLCHCILHHPFLLWHQSEHQNFQHSKETMSTAIKSTRQHAQQIAHILSYAKHSNLPVAASFYGYCSLISGTITALNSHASDRSLRRSSNLALQMNQIFLEDHARCYKNAANLQQALEAFVAEADTYSGLINIDDQTVLMIDTDRFYTLLDYGAQSSSEIGRGSAYGRNDVPTTITPNVFDTFAFQGGDLNDWLWQLAA